jgi:DNA polymerase (family 10)
MRLFETQTYNLHFKVPNNACPPKPFSRLTQTICVDNSTVANIFEELADLLELSGEETFKVVAYRRAAKNIRALSDNIEEVWRKNALSEIPGVGEAIAKKIDEILRTGRLALLERTRSKVPEGLIELRTVPLVGPKTAQLLYTKYGVKSKTQLFDKLQDGSLVAEGFSAKMADKILENIRKMGESASKMLLIEAMDAAYGLLDLLQSRNGFEYRVCGSIRRGKDLVGDVDIVVSTEKEGATLLDVANKLVGGKFLAKGENKVSWVSSKNVQFDFRLAKPDHLGAMMMYFTGSKEHNVKLRSYALQKGFRLSEYGLFDEKGVLVAGKTEEQVFSKLGLQYIEPELREDTGEIEAAASKSLPQLIDEATIQGDTHIHTNWSDGDNSLDEMVSAAEKLRYRYIVFTDHSKGERIANGMSEERLKRQAQEIEKLRNKHGSISILHGSEVNILREGRLDYDNETLKSLDFVVASLHKKFSSSVEVLTEAVLKAFENKYMDTLGHPTGRLLGRRGESGVNLAKVIVKARATGKYVEVDGQPRRMDLPYNWIKRAVEEGVVLTLSSDAHTTGELLNMQFAVKNARRGWAGPKNILNSSKTFKNSGH